MLPRFNQPFSPNIYPSDPNPSWEVLYNQEKERNSRLNDLLSEKERLIKELQNFNEDYYKNYKELEFELNSKIHDLESELHQKDTIITSKDRKIKEIESQMLLNSAEFDEIFPSNYKKIKYMTLGNEKMTGNMGYSGFSSKSEQEQSQNYQKLVHEVKVYQRFCECLVKAVIDCSPPETYKERPPTLKQVWKWIRGLIQEYMELKINNNKKI